MGNEIGVAANVVSHVCNKITATNMNKIKRIKNKDFTTISNVFLRDKNLSLKAKGFLSLIMGLPEDWEFSIRGICQIIKEGTTCVYSIISELKEQGYCIVQVVRDKSGKIVGNDYSFIENPQIDNPHVEKPNMDNPNQENQLQLNTNNNKENIEIKKDNIEKEYKEKFKSFVSLYKKMGGKVRGIDTEFKDFTKRHKDWKEILPYLSLAVQRETKARQQAKIEKKFFPEPKMLQTYLGKQRAWELYVTIGEDVDTNEYNPICDVSLNWNDYYKCYIYTGYWNGYIPDGYTDENRPNGAMVTLNNGRGTKVWNKEKKIWEDIKPR